MTYLKGYVVTLPQRFLRERDSGSDFSDPRDWSDLSESSRLLFPD